MTVTVEMSPSVIDEFFTTITSDEAVLWVDGLPLSSDFSFSCNSAAGEMVVHLKKNNRLKLLKKVGKKGELTLEEKYEDPEESFIVTVSEISSAEEVEDGVKMTFAKVKFWRESDETCTNN